MADRIAPRKKKKKSGFGFNVELSKGGVRGTATKRKKNHEIELYIDHSGGKERQTSGGFKFIKRF